MDNFLLDLGKVILSNGSCQRQASTYTKVTNSRIVSMKLKVES